MGGLKTLLIIIVLAATGGYIVNYSVYDYVSKFALYGSCKSKSLFVDGNNFAPLTRQYTFRDIKKSAEQKGYELTPHVESKNTLVTEVNENLTLSIGFDTKTNIWFVASGTKECTTPDRTMVNQTKQALSDLGIESAWVKASQFVNLTQDEWVF